MRNSFALELYLVVKKIAAKACKTGEQKCKCKPCKARKLLERNGCG